MKNPPIRHKIVSYSEYNNDWWVYPGNNKYKNLCFKMRCFKQYKPQFVNKGWGTLLKSNRLVRCYEYAYAIRNIKNI